jgi:hypothetical protein
VRPVLLVAVVIGACALGSAFSPAGSQPPDRLPDIPGPPAVGAKAGPHAPYGVGTAPFAHRAATSCAAASCHGGGRVGEVGSEHSTWAPEAFPEGATDPHNKAYSVLYNSVSTEMARKLGLGEAHKASLCLKCHAVDSAKEPDTRDQILSEGVGCGACHGPADKWVSIHYTAEWKALSNREKWEQYGFVPASNLVARTLNCASCHVGDADRDVNHDLYAAGHPRVTFEAARFHYQPDYRKHWVEKTPQPDFEVRVWVVGQAAALRKAVEVLHARADRAHKPDGVWPEFASYSCYSCHQTVGAGGGDVRGGLSDAFKIRAPGVPGWEVWSNAAIERAAEYCGSAYPGLSSPDLREVKELRRMMGEKRSPAPAAIKAQAGKVLAELDAWLFAMQAADDRGPRPVPKGTPERLAHSLARNALAKDGARLADHDWDALAANYLGSAAMFHAAGGPPGRWETELKSLHTGLRFPVTAGARFDGPADFDANKVKMLRLNFERLRDATAPTGGK